VANRSSLPVVNVSILFESFREIWYERSSCDASWPQHLFAFIDMCRSAGLLWLLSRNLQLRTLRIHYEFIQGRDQVNERVYTIEFRVRQ